MSNEKVNAVVSKLGWLARLPVLQHLDLNQLVNFHSFAMTIKSDITNRSVHTHIHTLTTNKAFIPELYGIASRYSNSISKFDKPLTI